ncbi:MAG: hypothetical protein ABJG41_19605 [Cyclobacteriaceae bacterium]
MVIKASSYRNWCTENISPQSWTRLVLKCLTQFRDRGFTLGQMESMESDFDLDAELLESLNQALEELYDMEVDEALLVRY